MARGKGFYCVEQYSSEALWVAERCPRVNRIFTISKQAR